jgi:hypothetical protein
LPCRAEARMKIGYLGVGKPSAMVVRLYQIDEWMTNESCVFSL